MNILFLGSKQSTLIDHLKSFGDKVISTEKPLSGDSDLISDIDFIVSYGYRHILKKDVLNQFPRKAINLHISLLPWNKGADPNLWSFLEDTPKGVTIHYLDEGVDTGDILAQQKVTCLPKDTLRTSYERLSKAVEDLFKELWLLIRENKLSPSHQQDGGSSHRKKDLKTYEQLLTKGWDTLGLDITGAALPESK